MAVPPPFNVPVHFHLVDELPVLVYGKCPAFRVTLPPHLIMLGNLDFFLEKQASAHASARTAVVADGMPSNFNHNNYD
jgi:hypothetical protein